MTWAQLMQAAGGKKHGTNSHFVPLNNLSSDARSRLLEIGQGDVDGIFSLRLTGTKRIYGIRDGRALKLIWYDDDHGDNRNAVVPVTMR